MVGLSRDRVETLGPRERADATVLLTLALLGCVEVAAGVGQPPCVPDAPDNSRTVHDRGGDARTSPAGPRARDICRSLTGAGSGADETGDQPLLLLKLGRNHREDQLYRARVASARKRLRSGGLCSTSASRAALHSDSDTDTDTWNAPSCPTAPGAAGARSGVVGAL